MSSSVEGDMEKSTGRQSSVPPRPNGTETKKDSNGSRKRNGGRWRENGNNGKGKNEGSAQRRPPQPQKSRPTSKQPRCRGYYNDRQKQEVMMNQEADYMSVFKPGSKKQNYNHLLNFSYGARDTGNEYSSRRRNNWRSKRSVRYNKEQFLQANCQFIVQEGEDFSVHTADPDTLVEWTFIEQVRLVGHGVPSCPICLYPPVAAKITRCGHCYCWKCILHYLSLSEKTWAKCPICFEAVHENDLKSVMALDMPTVSVGDTLTMTLMKRVRGSTYAAPVYQWQPRTQPHNIEDDNDQHKQGVDLCYSKLLTARPDQILSRIVEREKQELLAQLSEEQEGSFEAGFIQAALDALQKREAVLTRRKSVEEEVCAQLDDMSLLTDSEKETKNETKLPKPMKPSKSYSSAFSDEETEELPEETGEVSVETQSLEACTEASGLEASNDVQETSTEGSDSPRLSLCSEDDNAQECELTVEEAASDLALPEEKNVETSRKNANKMTDIYYFYQANDGQHIYMHSVNARCLVKEYGSLEKCPPTIQAKVVDIEGISMSEDLRPRLRYLSHLPLTCEFQVVELALKPPMVSSPVLDSFKEEIDRRHRQRQRKQRDEKRKLRKMQDVENKKMEKCPQLRASLGGLQHYNMESRSVIVPSDAPNLQAGGSGMSTPLTSNTPYGSPEQDDNGGQTALSFAQMLRAGKAKPQEPTKSASVSSSNPVVKSPGSDESDNEDRVPVPTYQDSFGDAIQAALNKATAADAQETSSGGGGKKKKKKVKQLLFSTSMNRNK